MSPMVDGEMMSIDDVLSSFGGVESPSRVSFTLRHPLRRAKSCKRRESRSHPAAAAAAAAAPPPPSTPLSHHVFPGSPFLQALTVSGQRGGGA